MSKRILIVTEYFYPEEFKINEIALAWKDKGYHVDVLTQNPTYPAGKIFDGYENKWYTKDVYQEINIYRLKAVTGYKSSLFKKLLKYFSFMTLGSLVSLKIGKKYDYVFGFDIAALTGMVPAVMLNKFYNKPVTLWIQDVWPDSVYAYGFKKTKILQYFLNLFVKSIYKNSSNLAVSGKGFIEKVRTHSSENKKIVYLPNWADEFTQDDNTFNFSTNKKIHFTFAGNVGKVQNLDNIIKAFGELDQKYLEQAQLNIIGDGSHLEALQNIVEMSNYKNIVFWGRKPRDEMYRYFNASDFLIVSLIDKPIFSLTVPAKTQTYIAVNKPILAIINGDTADIIRDNNLGFVSEPNDIDNIKNIFEQSITLSDEEKKVFTHNCQSLTETTFNKEKIIDALLELLKKGNS